MGIFEYHRYLKPVALEDVRFVIEKDTSYAASWKQSGGRSAWFMLKRKMDRLIAIMHDHDLPRTLAEAMRQDDIFAKIKEKPGGEDGSTIAEIRDLRRYLLLVEAEMINEKVVVPPLAADLRRPLPPEANGPGTPEDGGHHARDIDPDEEITGASRNNIPYPPAPRDLEDGVKPRGWKALATSWKGMSYYLVDRNAYPLSMVEHLPRLTKELNNHELEQLPSEYCGLYVWNTSESKWQLPRHYWDGWAK
jgi:hypothetical protein